MSPNSDPNARYNVHLLYPEKTSGDGPIDSGGDGPHDSGMEARITNLEADVSDIKGILKSLEPKISEMYGQMKHFPSIWNIAGVMLAINVGIVAVAALLVRLMAPGAIPPGP